jgi:hypothetical protein
MGVPEAGRIPSVTPGQKVRARSPAPRRFGPSSESSARSSLPRGDRQRGTRPWPPALGAVWLASSEPHGKILVAAVVGTASERRTGRVD